MVSKEINCLAQANNGRTVFLDGLRVAAICAVIMIHVSASNYYSVEVTTFEWKIFNIYDSLVRWAVPVFVMVSGALFLDNARPIEIGTLFRKNVLRIVKAFLFWSAFYCLTDYTVFHKGSFSPADFIKRFALGHYHLWYLYLIVGLYLVVPVLRQVTSNVRITRYFLILSLFFTFAIPSFLTYVNLISEGAYNFANKIIDAKLVFKLTLGYTPYYVAGYYLKTNTLNKKARYVLIILGIAAFFSTALVTQLVSVSKGEQVTRFYMYNQINILLESLFIFVLIQQKCTTSLNKTAHQLISLFAKYSFGIYLVHAFILELLYKFAVTTLSFTPVLSVPLISFYALILSFIAAVILYRIPFMRKHFL